MRPAELQALRRLLFFSRQEAALMAAASPERPRGVSDRTWRMWEDGERLVPEDVAGRMWGLAEWRGRAIAAGRARIAGHRGGAVALVWYSRMEEWATLPGREPVLWRPQQSVCAALLGADSRTVLVPFDGPAYAEWLAWQGGGEDDEARRARWAVTAVR